MSYSIGIEISTSVSEKERKKNNKKSICKLFLSLGLSQIHFPLNIRYKRKFLKTQTHSILTKLYRLNCKVI